MKSPSLIPTLLVAGITTITWNLSPVLSAQTASTDQTQSTKTTDSTADKNSSSTGMGQAGAPDKASTKDPTSLDKNPSTAPTGSADKAATKDTPPTEKEGMGASNKLTDKDFVMKAAQGGMTEVELGKVAQEKGASADVKQFGSHMVMDHSKANDELKAVATKNGMTVPGALDAKHQAIITHFNSLSGAAFDKAYVNAMVKDHEKTIAMFKEESASGENADVKAFAANTLPTIEGHLTDIKAIQAKMK